MHIRPLESNRILRLCAEVRLDPKAGPQLENYWARAPRWKAHRRTLMAKKKVAVIKTQTKEVSSKKVSTKKKGTKGPVKKKSRDDMDIPSVTIRLICTQPGTEVDTIAPSVEIGDAIVLADRLEIPITTISPQVVGDFGYSIANDGFPISFVLSNSDTQNGLLVIYTSFAKRAGLLKKGTTLSDLVIGLTVTVLTKKKVPSRN